MELRSGDAAREALIAAIRNGNVINLRGVIEAGTKINESHWNMCVELHQTSCLQVLLEQTTPHMNGAKLLLRAVEYKSYGCLRILAETGVDIDTGIKVWFRKGMTPLEYTTMTYRDVTAVRILLKCGAKVRTSRRILWYALDHSKWDIYSAIVDYLPLFTKIHHLPLSAARVARRIHERVRGAKRINRVNRRPQRQCVHMRDKPNAEKELLLLRDVFRRDDADVQMICGRRDWRDRLDYEDIWE